RTRDGWPSDLRDQPAITVPPDCNSRRRIHSQHRLQRLPDPKTCYAPGPPASACNATSDRGRVDSDYPADVSVGASPCRTLRLCRRDAALLHRRAPFPAITSPNCSAKIVIEQNAFLGEVYPPRRGNAWRRDAREINYSRAGKKWRATSPILF